MKLILCSAVLFFLQCSHSVACIWLRTKRHPLCCENDHSVLERPCALLLATITQQLSLAKHVIFCVNSNIKQGKMGVHPKMKQKSVRLGF